jgi:2-amino-4-hydroxy-6-hydroxymethyldihydropteridine diphosphokinase
MPDSTYLIALGSNCRTRWGSPRALITALINGGFTGTLRAASPVCDSIAIGPGQRRYANAVAVIDSALLPDALLAALKAIERAHGRRQGRRWGDRPLDLDIIGWSGGLWSSPGLAIPHPAFRNRRFVLSPLCAIAPGWRDPVTRLSARQLLARLDQKRPCS